MTYKANKGKKPEQSRISLVIFTTQTRYLDNKFEWIFISNMIVNMLQLHLCLVQAATFPGILKVSEHQYFGKVSL